MLRSWVFPLRVGCGQVSLAMHGVCLQQSMNKWVIIGLLLPLILAQCSTNCTANATGCCPNYTPYFSGCQPSTSATTFPFIIITVAVVLLQLFMLFVGLAVYRDIYQNLQLATLLTWKCGFEGGTYVMQAVNLGLASNNSFTDSFGVQFIVVVCVLGVFWILLVLVDRIPHNSTALLIRRKKIIFPVRIITLVFNMLLYCSLMQITSEGSSNVVAFVLGVLGVMVGGLMVVGVGVACNWKRFQVQDPHYYVLLQEMTSKRWYAKNNVLVGMGVRGLMVVAFAVGFGQVEVVGVLLVILQIVYALYLIAFIRYTKIRYYVFIVAANILMIGVLLLSFIGAVTNTTSPVWNQLSSAYIAFLLILAGLFFVANAAEVCAKRDIIARQLRSFYTRFIVCQKNDETVAMTKYDDHGHRQRVSQFKANLLYHKPLSNSKTAEIELVPSGPKRAEN